MWAAISFSRNNRRNSRESTRHRQKEARPAGDPTLTVERDTAARHDHVHVRMMRQAEPQVCNTVVIPMRAPRYLGSAAIVISVSADALNSRS